MEFRILFPMKILGTIIREVTLAKTCKNNNEFDPHDFGAPMAH